MMDMNEKAQITSDAKHCVHALDKKKLEYKEGEKVVYTVELTSLIFWLVVYLLDKYNYKYGDEINYTLKLNSML